MENNLITRKEKTNTKAEVDGVPITTGHWTTPCPTYLMGSHIETAMSSFYNGMEKEKVLQIYNFVIDVRNQTKIGQRKAAQLIYEKYGVQISENTISGWFHQKVVPFANEKTQFKPKPRPSYSLLKRSYIDEGVSASRLSKRFNVSAIIVINWLRYYNIPCRNHKLSMQTDKVKQLLRQKQLTVPTKQYSALVPEKAYLFGVLCGDGYINSGRMRLEIRHDKEFTEEFLRCISSVYGLNYHIKYYLPKNTFIVDISCHLMCSDLYKYGIFDTWNWIVPISVANSNDRNVIGYFLRGLFDSEGSVSKYSIMMTTASVKGADGVVQLLSKLGIECHNRKYRQYRTLTITHADNMSAFRDAVGFSIKRKMEKLCKALNERKYHVQKRTRN